MSRDARTNRRIRARELRVIGPEGEQLGILSLEAALARAGEAGLDLVEVSPMAKPPVCKIMDYGRFKYEAKKKQNEAKKKQVVVKLKEIKLRPRTDEHDYDVKIRQAREFLEEGHKIKVTIVFRGREIAHREIGQKQLQEMVADLKDVAIIEQAPRMEGKAMFMLLGANPKNVKPPPRPVADARPPLPRPAGAPPPRQPQNPPGTRPAAGAPPAAGAAPSGATPAGATPAGATAALATAAPAPSTTAAPAPSTTAAPAAVATTPAAAAPGTTSAAPAAPSTPRPPSPPAQKPSFQPSAPASAGPAGSPGGASTPKT